MRFPIGVGVVGASAQNQGWATLAHLPAIEALPDFRLAGVSTSNARSARAAEAAFGVPAHASIGELIAQADVDLLVIAVKVTAHRELLLEALGSGKLVYSEWPLGVDLGEAEALAAAAEQSGARTVIGLQGRYDPIIRQARELVEQGYLGELLSTSLRASAVSWGTQADPSQAYSFDEANGATPLSITALNAFDAVAMVLGEPEAPRAWMSRHPNVVRLGGGETIPTSVPRHVAITGRIGDAPLLLEVDGGTTRGTGLSWTLTGTEGELVVSSPTPNGNIQATTLELHGGRGADTAFARIPAPAGDGLPAGPAGNVARLYAALAGDLRTGERTVPDFAHARDRHRLLDRLVEDARDRDLQDARG